MMDLNIINKIHDGDNHTFKIEVFDKYYLPLCLFCRRYIEDDDVIDDIVQDVFLKLWERRRDFEMIPAIKSFLYLSVKNSCFNWIKHQNVKMRNQVQMLSYFLDDDDQIHILDAQVYAKLYAEIQCLPDRSQQMVIMTMNGSSNAEIAEKLGVSVNTVKTLKLRAYRVLRENLKDLQWLVTLIFALCFTPPPPII